MKQKIQFSYSKILSNKEQMETELDSKSDLYITQVAFVSTGVF